MKQLLLRCLGALPLPVKVALRLPGLLARRVRVSRKLGRRCGRQVFRAYLAFWSAGKDRRPSGETAVIDVPDYPRPVEVRLYTSDIFVFDQVFVEDEYGPLRGLADVRTAVDCGANIGCTAAYLLRHHPEARLIAVEPDPGNAAVCRRNVAAFGPRAEVVQAGVWWRPAGLRVVRGGFRDGREWSFQVAEAGPGEPAEVQAVGVPELIDRAGADRIDILKIDIEGAELAVFTEGSLAWLDRVRCLAVEAHGPACHAAVVAAAAKHGFTSITKLRETLFCFRGPPA